MHIQKDYHICDHCKSVIPLGKMKKVVLPIECESKPYGAAKEFKIELCNDCYKELLHVIRKHFHQWSYSYYGELVDEEEEENE